MIQLRDFIEKDVNDLATNANSEDVVKYMSYRMPYPYTIDDAWWWIRTGSKELGINKAICLNDRFIGVIGVTPGSYERKRSGEIGYWIGEKYWGKGFATNAVKVMTDFIFETTDIFRLFAPVYHPNIASMKVLEKNGYSLEAVHKKAIWKDNKFYDEHIFAKLRS